MANLTDRKYKITVEILEPYTNQHGYETEGTVKILELSLADFSMDSFMDYLSQSGTVKHTALKTPQDNPINFG